jgi:uncharacterized protein YndB with AHSA1/START domain
MLDLLFYLSMVLAVAIVAIFAYASSRPDTFQTIRSMRIKAPPEKIFPLINNLNAFNRWNPFLAKDTATKLNYRGPIQGKGAAHDWDGNNKVGKGSVEITESQPPSRILMKLDMIKPMEAHNRVEFTLQPNGDATTVTWAMSGRQPLMAKVMTVFIDCDKMVGSEFERGLTSLKAIAEQT